MIAPAPAPGLVTPHLVRNASRGRAARDHESDKERQRCQVAEHCSCEPARNPGARDNGEFHRGEHERGLEPDHPCELRRLVAVSVGSDHDEYHGYEYSAAIVYEAVAAPTPAPRDASAAARHPTTARGSQTATREEEQNRQRRIRRERVRNAGDRHRVRRASRQAGSRPKRGVTVRSALPSTVTPKPTPADSRARRWLRRRSTHRRRGSVSAGAKPKDEPDQREETRSTSSAPRRRSRPRRPTTLAVRRAAGDEYPEADQHVDMAAVDRHRAEHRVESEPHERAGARPSPHDHEASRRRRDGRRVGRTSGSRGRSRPRAASPLRRTRRTPARRRTRDFARSCSRAERTDPTG